MRKIPLSASLSYIWGRVTRNDTIYSHLFREQAMADVLSEFSDSVLYQHPVNNFHWAQARVIDSSRPEKDKRYLVSAFTYRRHNTFGVTGDRRLLRADYHTPYTRDEALQVILMMEKNYIKSNFLPERQQPFVRAVHTVLRP